MLVADKMKIMLKDVYELALPIDLKFNGRYQVGVLLGFLKERDPYKYDSLKEAVTYLEGTGFKFYCVTYNHQTIKIQVHSSLFDHEKLVDFFHAQEKLVYTYQYEWVRADRQTCKNQQYMEVNYT